MYPPKRRRHRARPSLRRTLQALAAFATAALTVAGLISIAAPATAAPIDRAITSVSTDKSAYGYNERLALTFGWAVPDDARPGDTFTLQLPPELQPVSLARFELDDPTGAPVATAVWDGRTVTFTLTDYVATHDAVSGSGHLSANWDHANVTDAGGPVTLDFGVSTTTITIDPKPVSTPCETNCGPPPVRTERGVWKGSSWADGAYEGTRDATDNINWLVEVPGNQTGYDGPVDVADTVGGGSIIDCATLKITTRASLAGGTPSSALDPGRYTLDCADGGFHLVIDRVGPSEFINVDYKGTITDQRSGTYSNTVAITAPGQSWNQSSTIKRTDAGGVGDGVQSVSVGDYVWFDADKDGIQDSGEKGIPGVTLVLTGPDGKPVTDVTGKPVAPTVTGSQGHYTFGSLPVLAAGQHYTVTLDASASAAALSGLVPTTAGSGSDRALDSATGSAESGDLITNRAADTTLDFGFIRPSVSVGDYVWVDADGNGRQDQGESGIPGVTLVLTGPDGKPVTDVDGTPVTPTVTDAHGHYAFTGLPVLAQGQHYTVSIDRAASADALQPYQPTVAHRGDTAGDSSTWEADSGSLTADGAQDLTLDFGFIVRAVPAHPAHSADPADPAVAPVPTPAPVAAPAQGASLAHTGLDIAVPVAAGLLLTALGAAGVLFGRRRRLS